MNNAYAVRGWVFVKVKEDSKGSYYDITHPSGRKWDYAHLFHSYDEILDYVNQHCS